MEPYQTFNLSERGYFYSCNMAILKSKLIEREGFHPEATGDAWVGDGETGLNRDMQTKGDLIGYVPGALTYHHIPASRMTRLISENVRLIRELPIHTLVIIKVFRE